MAAHESRSVEAGLSAECGLARTPGYEDLHGDCRQLADVSMPGAAAVLLLPRCRCACHHARPAPERVS
ncbi:hypothetical protein GCM10023220_39850 [Streptomyces ziwulingensis]|uniref:Uncharacterized protein n=1 Tax=Streptomyces ziwulingensis TaxID=1045501 RepID=A0ABP9C885_9ACTN